MGNLSQLDQKRLQVPLSAEEYAKNFCDIHPPLDAKMAAVESARCYFCYDAPCMEACPTHINIPEFIRRIHTGNRLGAGVEILDANILGGTCARVCPVEILCEQACVRTKAEEKPVTIGLLQRFATDYIFEKKIQPFKRAAPTGKKFAVVGAGPAGLSCAHKLSMLGHEVEIFEAKPKAGGLNEYGIAAYKMLEDFAQKEVELLLSLGGITLHYEQALGRDFTLASLRKRFDSVFLAAGLAGVNALKLEGENLPGVINAVDYISELRQAKHYADLKIGKRVIVIGGGNTAIDIAIQSKALGAEEVTLVYRRGASDMSATKYEQDLAQTHGVVIKFWSKPVAIQGDTNGVSAVVFEKTRKNDEGNLVSTGEKYTIETDVVFKAVGQVFLPNSLGQESEVLELANGKIKVNALRKTSLAGVYAGGDCIAHKEDLTVVAVQDGKLAAHAMDLAISSRGRGVVQNG
ncbi:MAG: NAD(P)-dependent oxidoreductase [Bdellovibrionales bacterium]|nr:NAD(P)-dependent oxidoreductase [Oligoflexia bacterium]